jgi:ATP-dependent protease ClpP protease subunit
MIATQCPRLYIMQNSVVLFHPYTCTYFGFLKLPCAGKDYDRGLKTLDRMTAKALGITLAEYIRQRDAPEMWVFDAEDAIAMGFASVLVDEIVFQ